MFALELIRNRQPGRLTALLLPAVCLVSCFVVAGCKSRQDRARSQLEESLESRRASSRRSDAHYRQGLAAYQGGELESAAQALESAIREVPEHSFAWVLLGAVEYERQRYLYAGRAFERAAKLAPDRFEGHFSLGLVFETVGNRVEAIPHYRKALEIAPKEVEVLENLARCLIEMREQLDEAEELIDLAIELEHRPEWLVWLRRQKATLQAESSRSRSPTRVAPGSVVSHTQNNQ